MTGTTLSHYRVMERIGEGATSVVYKAEDLALGRPVALKLLPPALSVDLGRIARFQHEARTTSTLNHPNICTIYEIDQHEDRHFIAMEFLEGQPLSTLLGGRPMECYRLVELCIQIADGLEAAHAERVIHRDLKPANIYVTHQDRVKLLDFGLAVLMPSGSRSRNPSSATWLAEPGGTTPYMSPEQTLGEQLDTRSDLFSFGIVLYEMATGGRPFSGSTNAAVMEAIRQESAFPARDLNTAVPDELNRIIEKALEKDRKLRYQTASDICADLRRLKRDLDSQGRVVARAPIAVTLPSTPAAPSKQRSSLISPAAILQLLGAAAIGGLAVFGFPSASTPVSARPPNAEPAATDRPLPVVEAPPPAVPADRPGARTTEPPAVPPVVGAGLQGESRPGSREGRSSVADPGRAENSRAGSSSADKQLQIARAKIDLELYDQALDTLRDLIKANGSVAEAQHAYLLMASVHEKRGNREEAIATFLEMATRFPDSPRAAEALFGMAKAMLQSKRQGREGEALRIYTDIATRFQSTPWAAQALMARGRLEEQQRLRQRDPASGASVPSALITYRDLVGMHPKSVEREHALWRLSQLYIGLKTYDLAAASLRDLAEHHPASGYDAWFAAAEIYDKRLSEDVQARAAYAQVPSTSPRYADAQKRLARR